MPGTSPIPRLSSYRLVHRADGQWQLRYDHEPRCEWGAAWPAEAVLTIAARTLAAETAVPVRWRRINLLGCPNGSVVYRPEVLPDHGVGESPVRDARPAFFR
jgi:hypothetical protein